MTRQRNLKRRVRERMRATGEPYTSARMHVLGEAPAEMRDAPLPGVHHATTALRNALAPRIGAALPSEALLLVVAGGIGAGVFAFRYPEFSSLFLAGRHLWQDDAGYYAAATERLGLSWRVWETGSARRAEQDLDESLETGEPVIAFVDQASLGYRPGVEAYYSLVVLAADAETVTLADVADRPLVLERRVFAAARGRIRKFRHRLQRLESGTPQLTAEALLGGLRACVESLRDPGMGRFQGNFTLDAFSRLAERIRGKGGKDGWDAVFPRGERLFGALVALGEYIEHYGTGGGLMRPLFAQGLREAAGLLPGAGLEEVAERYEALGEAWSALARSALPADVPLLHDAAVALAERQWIFLEQGLPEDGPSEGDGAPLDRLRAEAESFPLTEAEAAALRQELADALDGIVAGERAALEALADRLTAMGGSAET